MKLNDTIWLQKNPNISLMALIIWRALWKARNNFIFKGVSIEPQKVVCMVQNMCNLKSKWIANKGSRPNTKIVSYLANSFNGVLVIFTDVAYHCKDGESSFGCIFMLNNVPIYARGHYESKLIVFKEAEAMAILFILKEASSRGFPKVVLFSKAKEVELLPVDNTINIIPSIKGFLPKRKCQVSYSEKRLRRVILCWRRRGHNQSFFTPW